MVKNSSLSEQGRKNKAAGARFERKVRSDLESRDWIVSKWMNNVEFLGKAEVSPDYKTPEEAAKSNKVEKIIKVGKLIPAKHKFRGPGIPMAIGTGFPDFIAYKSFEGNINERPINHVINGVECKSNGFLTREEKEKCKWLLANNIFSKIFIAKKGSKRGEIIYKEFK